MIHISRPLSKNQKINDKIQKRLTQEHLKNTEKSSEILCQNQLISEDDSKV